MRDISELKRERIGFIGQGFIGSNLADNFYSRGFHNLVRYSLDPQYVGNKDKIKECSFVFVAVPTPTREGYFDDKILRDCMDLVSPETVVVIKSTVRPDTVRKLLKEHPDKYILHSPEFLSVNTAKEDTDNPDRNIIGVPYPTEDDWYRAALDVLTMLPYAPYHLICTPEESSLIKYGGNCFFYVKNVFFNVLADIAEKTPNVSWSKVREGIVNDPRIHSVHTAVVDKGGRGAGGYCLPKDFSALLEYFLDIGAEEDKDKVAFMRKAQECNKKYLKDTRKDPDIYKEVYGEDE